MGRGGSLKIQKALYSFLSGAFSVWYLVNSTEKGDVIATCSIHNMHSCLEGCHSLLVVHAGKKKSMFMYGALFGAAIKKWRQGWFIKSKPDEYDEYRKKAKQNDKLWV